MDLQRFYQGTCYTTIGYNGEIKIGRKNTSTSLEVAKKHIHGVGKFVNVLSALCHFKWEVYQESEESFNYLALCPQGFQEDRGRNLQVSGYAANRGKTKGVSFRLIPTEMGYLGINEGDEIVVIGVGGHLEILRRQDYDRIVIRFDEIVGTLEI